MRAVVCRKQCLLIILLAAVALCILWISHQSFSASIAAEQQQGKSSYDSSVDVNPTADHRTPTHTQVCPDLPAIVPIPCAGCPGEDGRHSIPPPSAGGPWVHVAALRRQIDDGKDGRDIVAAIKRRMKQEPCGDWIASSQLRTQRLTFPAKVSVLSAATNGAEKYWTKVNNFDWEPTTFRDIAKYVKADYTVIDFGTWIGPTVLAFAARARRVIGIEPDFVSFSVVSANVALNPSLKDKITIRHMCIAVSNKTKLAMNSDAPGSSSNSVGTCDCKKVYRWEVPCQTLPMVVQEEGLDDSKLALKIDVEGYERLLLPSLVPWLKDRQRRKLMPTIFLSRHRGYPNTPAEKDFFKSFVAMFQSAQVAPDGRQNDVLLGTR